MESLELYSPAEFCKKEALVINHYCGGGSHVMNGNTCEGGSMEPHIGYSYWNASDTGSVPSSAVQ